MYARVRGDGLMAVATVVLTPEREADKAGRRTAGGGSGRGRCSQGRPGGGRDRCGMDCRAAGGFAMQVGEGGRW